MKQPWKITLNILLELIPTLIQLIKAKTEKPKPATPNQETPNQETPKPETPNNPQ